VLCRPRGPCSVQSWTELRAESCFQEEYLPVWTLLKHLYSFPPQNGDNPPETSMYRMTPMAQRSEAKVAWLHLITSGDMNSKVPHMLIGIESCPLLLRSLARCRSYQTFFSASLTWNKILGKLDFVQNSFQRQTLTFHAIFFQFCIVSASKARN